MKRFRQFIQEARRNPDQNPKISAVEYLRKWKDDSDVYISFTEIDKIGINPKSKYNTPLGIYTYPLKEIWEMYHVEARGSLKSLPFAANEPHIFVLKVNHSKGKFINDMYSDYGSDKYDKDIETLKNLFLNFDSIKKQRERLFNQQYTLKKTFKPDKKEVEAEIDEELEKKFNFMVGSALSTRKDQNAIMGFWKLTKDLSMFLGKQNAGGSDPVKWNWILRQCGYIGFGDKTGKGYIHPAEPTQAVFLQKDAFTIIGETLNKDYGKNGNAYSEYGVESIEYTGSPLPWEIDNALGDWFFKATAKGIKLSIDCTNENSLLFTAGSIADVTITSGQFNSVGLTKCKISNTSDPNMSFTECKILD
jgi:hypothetical protein